jgi:hypothetical protein
VLITTVQLSWKDEKAIVDTLFDIGLQYDVIFSPLFVPVDDGKSFRKHKEVRSALHRDYIKPKMIGTEWGKHFDWLFDNRQKAAGRRKGAQ